MRTSYRIASGALIVSLGWASSVGAEEAEGKAAESADPVEGEELAVTAEDPNSPARGRELSPADGPSATPVSEAPVSAPTQEEPLVPAWLENFTLGGGAILYYYQPLEGGDANFSLFFANLVLDGKWGVFGLHIEPRFRDTRLRPFFEGPAWVQEAYGSVELAPVTLKAGKIYKRAAGLFWDNSFYGNVQVYDGLKLDPNYGVSAEGSWGEDLGVDFAAQFFLVDGRTNVSLQGRDTISIPDARRRNTVAGRVAPRLKFGAGGTAQIGLGAEHFQADVPDQVEGVTRFGADAKVTYDFGAAGKLGAWGEYIRQEGRHVLDHPAVGAASGKNDYALIGAEYSFWRLTARYNVSFVDYSEVDVTEVLHVPSLTASIHDNLTLLGELVIWRQDTPAGVLPYDTSLNVTLHGRF